MYLWLCYFGFSVCFSIPTMSLIEIQMKSEDEIYGDKLGAPSGSAAPLTHTFCSKLLGNVKPN